MFIKIKIARIYRKNIIIYMGVEEEQLGGKRRVYKSVKKPKSVGKPKKVVKAMKVVPKRTGLSPLKPMYRGRLGMHLGGQQGMGLAGMFSALTTPQQTAVHVASAAPAAPPAPPAHVATPQQVAAFTQQMHQQHAHQQHAEEVKGGRPRRHRSRSTSKVVKAKPKARAAGKMMKPRAKKNSSRGGFEEEQEQEEMEMVQSGGFQQLQALEKLVDGLSGGGYERKRVVRHRPVVRRSPSPVARRRRPAARRT